MKSISGAYLEITRPRLISAEKQGVNCATFVYGPLAPGYAITLGNSLRRILLSSIPGCGIVYIEIEGVSHFMSTIDHVEENTIEIIERLKQIRFKMNSDLVNSRELIIDVSEIMKKHKDPSQDSFIITSAMVPQDEIVEILNDIPLFTVNTNHLNLKIRLLIERGVGYLDPNSMQRKDENIPHGCIPVNTPFNAVRRAVFTNPPEKMIYGEFTSYELLKIEVETDGSITPNKALETALNLFREIIDSMRTAGAPNETHAEEKMEVNKIMNLMSKSITELPIKEAIIRTLNAAGITEVGHLCALSKEDALRIPRLGITKVELIQQALESFNLTFQSQKDNQSRGQI